MRSQNEIDKEVRGLIIRPNPGAGVYSLQIAPYWMGGELMVYDIGGKLVMKQKADASAFDLNIMNCGKGMYIIHLVKNDRQINKKIIFR